MGQQHCWFNVLHVFTCSPVLGQETVTTAFVLSRSGIPVIVVLFVKNFGTEYLVVAKKYITSPFNNDSIQMQDCYKCSFF